MFFCLLTTFCFAQTTAIPDANFEQFLVNQGIDTNGLNGNILDGDAQTVTALNVNVNTITDFTGLESFINIVTLQLGANQFPLLSLNTLTKLESLSSINNAALNSLDLTQNTLLQTLDLKTNVSNIPPIISLDLSNNVLLQKLNLKDLRNLETLILPETATLTEIEIFTIKASDLNFSKLDGLHDLRISETTSPTTVTITLPDVKTVLKDLYLSGINLPTINLSAYVALEDLTANFTNFETLLLPTTNTLKKIFISGHKINSPISMSMVPELTSLHLEGNSGTTPLQIDLTDNLALVRLELDFNKIQNIDLSKNLSLTHLSLFTNDLTTLDVTNNTELVELKAPVNNISTLDLTKNLNLTILDLNRNLIPSINLTKNTKLGYLAIAENLLSGTGIDLTQNISLGQLNAQNNQIESLDISENKALFSVILNHNLFSGTDILDQFYNLRLSAGLWRGGLQVSHNQLSGEIPDFLDLINYGSSSSSTIDFILTFDNNKFHFGDFEDQHLDYVNLLTTSSFGASKIFKFYHYAPQAKVNTIENPIKNAGESITMTTTVRGNQNHYKWFKDGIAIIDADDSPNYIIDDLSLCDKGVYYCEITSDLVPFENSSPPGTNGKNLLLIRNDITLDVNASKSCVLLSNPLNNTTNVPINTGLEWGDHPGACGYKLSVGTTSGGTDIINNEDVGEITLYNFTSNLPSNSDIFVTVIPYFDDGDFASCTEEKFKTSAVEAAPDCSTLTNPLHNANGVSVNTDVSWSTANGAANYRISVGTASGGTDILPLTDVGNVLTYDLPTDLPENTEIFVTIMPYNGVGDATGCTEESFTTETAATIPNCTSLSTPSDGDADISISTDLTWNAISNATGYRLTVGTTSNGTDILDGFDVGNVLTYDLPTDLPENTEIFVTIVPYNEVGDAIGCTEESFTIETAATIPNCTSLSVPLNNATNISVSTDLNWNAISNATGYRLSVGTTSNGTDILPLTDVGNVLTYDLPTDLPENTEVFVTIIPYNGVGDATGCTEESFTTDTAATIPNCTSLSTPSDGDADISISTDLTWGTLSNTTGYRLSVGTTSNGTDILPLTDVGNVLTYDLPTDLPENTEVFVTIVPYNGVGDATGCSEESFTTETAATLPNCTQMTFPLNGSVGNVDAPNITWNPIANATGYRITLGTTSGGNEWIDNFDTGTNTTYQHFDDFTDESIVYVNIIPYNSVGDAISCLEESFMVGGTVSNVPNCTAIRVPLDGDTNVSVSTDLTWGTLSNTTGYRLSVGTTSNGTDILDGFDVGNVLTYDLPTDLPENTEIFVTIVPYNEVGDAIGCTEESFTIETAATIPNCTSLSVPLNNATNISVSTDLNWNAISNATRYRLSVGTTSNGTDILPLTDVGNVLTYDLPTDLPENTEVFVTIIPYNGVGDATGCTEESFTTDTAATIPNCTSLSTPSDGDADISISTDLTWGTLSNTTGYRLSVGTTSNGTDILPLTDVGNVLTYDLPTDLPENTEVFVTIVPYNGVGDATGCSEESFTTETAATLPNCTQMTFPLNGSVGNVDAPNITWNPIANATGYRITLGTTSGGNEWIDNFDTGTNTTYQHFDDFTDESIVYVNIIPYNSVGDAISCLEESFMVGGTVSNVPNCTAIRVPLDGDTNVSVSTDLTWGTLSNTTGYRLSVGTTSNGTDILPLTDVGNVLTYDLPTDLPENTEVFVTIVPYNGVGDATGCSEESFTTETVATIPNCTTLSSPLNNATDVAITTDLTWNTVNDVDGYRISIGTTTGGTDLVNNEDVGDITAYNPTNDFPENTTIYVSITPYNATGDATGCTEESFSTETIATVPNCTTSNSPLNNATDVAITSDLTWDTVSNADGYRISIGTTTGGTDLVNNENIGNITTYNLTNDFPENTTIYVSITPYNVIGDAENCVEVSFSTQILEDETKYGFSPNGDGQNDDWQIVGIENNPDNIVSIYNRWGDLVFQAKGYNNSSKVFNGTANKLSSLGAGELPSGTYFFDIQINGSHKLKKLKGYLILKR